MASPPPQLDPVVLLQTVQAQSQQMATLQQLLHQQLQQQQQQPQPAQMAPEQLAQLIADSLAVSNQQIADSLSASNQHLDQVLHASNQHLAGVLQHHQQQQEQQAQIPKGLKDLKLRPWDPAGSETYDAWIFHAQQWVDLQRLTLDSDKIKAVTLVLIGAANTWWRNLAKRDDAPTSWEDFVKAFKAHHRPPQEVEDLDARFWRFYQAKLSCKEHITAHHALLNDLAACEELEDFTEGQLVRHFIQSCTKELKARITSVPSSDRDTLAKVYETAVKQYAILKGMQPQMPNLPKPSPAKPPLGGPQPMDLSALNSGRRGPLTPEERQYRADKQLCRYCGSHADNVVCPKNGKINDGRGGQAQQLPSPAKPQLRPFPKLNNIAAPEVPEAPESNPQAEQQLNER